jgi:uncharacterized protein YbbC (DUF1343 family)
MTTKVVTGIAKLRQDQTLQKRFKGNIALLCHSASIDSDYRHSLEIMLDVFGKQIVKVFGPQHGFVTDVQDNMKESDHYVHPYFKLPIYSLYSETRIPTDEMLEGIDHLFIDLQDVGTRIYTYIYTMTYILEKCADKNIEIVILDRPNPIDGITLEGNVLDTKFASFVGRHALPVRHGLTMAEVALMHQKYWATKKCNLSVICMDNYQRSMEYEQTGLPWVLPSPNLPTVDGCFTFVGTVLFEGTNISEGRGTTRPLEIVGHPKIESFEFKRHLDKVINEYEITGHYLRPIAFQPTFQKHAGIPCGGYFIHATDRKAFKPWRLCQILCKEFKQHLGVDFKYKTDPYEYEYEMNPVDMINGTDRLRQWYEEKGNYQFLDQIEQEGLANYQALKKTIEIYK